MIRPPVRNRRPAELPPSVLMLPCECPPEQPSGRCITCKRWALLYLRLMARMRAWGSA